MKHVGITEGSDAGTHFEWIDKMDSVAFAILISKNVSIENERFHAAVGAHQKQVMVHATCTGFGNTKIEPHVPSVNDQLAGVEVLVSILGLEKVVLRVDPIVPTVNGLKTLVKTLDAAQYTGVKRVRYSIMQCYSHVNKRFIAAGIAPPYGGAFQPTHVMKDALYRTLDRYSERYDFESCAYGNKKHMVGCISERDMKAFELTGLTGASGQRSGCLCPANKLELLDRSGRCEHGCLYCYWK